MPHDAFDCGALLQRSSAHEAQKLLGQTTLALLRSGRGSDAEACAQLAVQAAGGATDEAVARRMLASVYSTRSDHDAAVGQLQSALRLVPTVPGGWLELARASYALRAEGPHRVQGAATALTAALRLRPDAKNWWELLADAYHDLSRYDFSYAQRAADACQSALLLAPRSAETYTNMGKVLGELGRHDEAIDATRHAVGVDGTYGHRYQLAEALRLARRHSEARVLYRELVRAGGGASGREAADVHNHLAVSLLDDRVREGQAQRGREAAHAAAAAIRLAPDCEYAHAHNYYQVLAHAYRVQGRLELAAAALWPVAAAAGRHSFQPGHAPAYAITGFEALAAAQRALGRHGAAATTERELRALGLSPAVPPPSTRGVTLPHATASSLSGPGSPRAGVGSLKGEGEGGSAGAFTTATGWSARLRRAREAAAAATASAVADSAGLAATAAPPNAKPTHSRMGSVALPPSTPVSPPPSPPPLAAQPPAASPPPLPQTSVPASGAIVYLCCADEAEALDLIASVASLYDHFNRRARYPGELPTCEPVHCVPAGSVAARTSVHLHLHVCMHAHACA